MGIYTPNSPYPFFIRPQSPNPRIRRPEDATLARYGDLKKLYEKVSIVDITSNGIYNLSVNGKLSPGTRYRITDYKSVNFLHGYYNASNNNPPTYIPAFTPYAPVNTNLGTGAGAGAVASIAQDTISTGVYVGGSFSNINGNDPTYFQKLNADGTPNNVFNNNYFDVLSVSPGFNNDIRTIAVQADGKVLVGGNFTSLNATVRNYLVRFNANGTLDTAFYANLGTGFDNDVYTIAVQSDGKILVGGGFSNLNMNVRNGLVRLNADGTEDTTFATNIGTAAGLTNSVQKVLISQTGKIYVLGTFASWNGTLSRSIARLNANGTFDNTFVSGLTSAKSFYFIHELTNGDILLSGLTPGVETWAGNPIASYVYSVSPTGVLLNNSWGNITADIVYAVTTLSTNEVIISGAKTTNCDGYPVIAVYSEAGVKNTVYDPLVSFSSDVFSLAVMGNDEYLMCGGSFGLTYRTNPNPQTLIALNLSTVGPYQARAAHVSDPEVLVVTAANGYELDPVGYSETYGDAISYMPYFNALGIIEGIDNNMGLPNGNPLSGFDLQWSTTENVAYFTMPQGYPVEFGNYFVLQFNTTLPCPECSCYLPFEPVKPGLNYSFEYDPGSLIRTPIIISPDGYTVKLPDVTFAQYQAYSPDSLFVEVVAKEHDAYGIVTWRKDFKANVEAPYDWRNYRFRRYSIDLADINGAYGGIYYRGTTDTYPTLTTGDYFDYPSLFTYKEYYNDGVNSFNDASGSYPALSDVVLTGTFAIAPWYYYHGVYDNTIIIYAENVTIDVKYMDGCTFNGMRYGSIFGRNYADIIQNMWETFTMNAWNFTSVVLWNAFGITIEDGVYINGLYFPFNQVTSFKISTAGSYFAPALGGDKTALSLSGGEYKNVMLASDNTHQMVTHNGTTFVSTPF